MKTISLLAVAAFAISLSRLGAQERPPQNSATIPKFAVSTRVPPSNALAKLPYQNRDHWNLRAISDEKIRNQETEYSWFWFEIAVPPAMLPKPDANALRFASNVGPHGDDAAFISWQTNGYDCELIDSRLLTFLLRKEGLANSDILEVLAKTINFARYGGGLRITITNQQTHKLSANKSWGIILVDRDRSTGWFNRPIVWYRDGDFVLFVIEKKLEPTPSKIGHKPSQIIGGIPIDDARKWLRFEESNREQLSREYYEQPMNQRPHPPVAPKGIKNPAGVFPPPPGI